MVWLLMAAAGRNFSRPKNQNASRKQPVPVPRARPIIKDKFSSKNSAAENIYNNLNGSDDNATPLSQLDYNRSKLQKRISQQESQQARFLAASEILKLDIQFFPKYKVVDLWKMLKENEVWFCRKKIFHSRNFFLSIFFLVFNQFQAIVAFHTETSHLICDANQITGFYMKWNRAELNSKYVKQQLQVKDGKV